MTLLDSLFAQGVRALREPRAAAADVLTLGFPRSALAPALFLVVAISVILNTIGEYIAPNPFLVTTPFQLMVFFTLSLVIFSVVVAKIGQWAGGVGEFYDSLLLTIFQQSIFIVALAAQTAMLFLMPALAGMFILIATVFLIWLNVNFVAALHGFNSLGRALGVLILASLVTFFALMLIAPLLVTPTGGFANV